MTHFFENEYYYTYILIYELYYYETLLSYHYTRKSIKYLQ